MNALSASVDHVCNGRLRLGLLPERHWDRAALQSVAEAIAARRGVREVRANARTGSVVVWHEGETPDLLADIEAAGVLRWEAVGEESHARGLFQDIDTATCQLDGFIRRVTSEQLDIRSAAGLVMASLGLFQAGRGKMLPAGLTLLNQAMFLLMR